MMWERKTLGELCTITKGNIGITKAIEGEYPLVVTSEERKSHNEYQFDDEAVVIPLVSSTGHGHKSLKRIHYQKGKFAVGTILCAVISKDKSVLDTQYLFRYLFLNKEKELVGRMRGMANVTLPIKEIAKIEIPLPPLKEQLKFVEDYNSLEKNKIELDSEITHQLNLVKQLRQAFLREAMQGKLVEQDKKDEPASVLLEKIKAKKEQLIKDKKIKKHKPLSSISEEEIPFEIPESWVWCRLGDICEKIGSGSTPKGSNYSESGFPFFRSQNIHDSGLVYDDIKFISEPVQLKMSGTKVIANDILLNITGGSLGRCALVPLDFKEGNVSQHVLIIRPILSNTSFIHKLVLSPLVQQYIFNSTTGAGREGLPKYNLEQFVLPLPPFSEQKRIVAKLNELMQYCDQLEESIKNSQQQNELLLQQVLREALEPQANSQKKSEDKEETKVISLKPTNVDYYRRTVLAAEIVWQLQKEPTLGHLKLQKLIYLCQRTANMQLPTNFSKQAMGPYDPQMMRSIDKQLKQKKWFQYKKTEFLKYVPLENSGQHQQDFTKYFSDQQQGIQYIIDTFKNKKSDIIEITATLYACLEEMHNKNIIYSEPMLLQMFYDWSERKEDFSGYDVKRVFKAMQSKGIVPNTFKN